MEQKPALQMPVLQPPRTFEDEIILGEALQQTKIGKSCDIEPLKAVLRYVMVLVGLRAQNFPNADEKAVLLDYIISNYGGHTPAEIKLAFSMAVQNKLDLAKGFDVHCYENFSVLYFSGIMNAYRKWAKEAIDFIPKTDQPALPTSEITDEEFIAAVQKLYLQHRNYKKIPVLAYKILEPKLSLTREDKLRIKQYVHETTKEGDLVELSRQYAVKEYFDKL